MDGGGRTTRKAYAIEAERCLGYRLHSGQKRISAAMCPRLLGTPQQNLSGNEQQIGQRRSCCCDTRADALPALVE